MLTKEVYLFDTTNSPLRVSGIRVELFDCSTGTLLDTQNSANLATSGATLSNDWGVLLRFQSVGNPVDIYFCDPMHRYPGNVVRSLNGQVSDRLDVDLLSVPTRPGGQMSPPSTATPASITEWVKSGYRWSAEDKRGVLNLCFNYSSVIVPRFDELFSLEGLHGVAEDWGEALRHLGIPPEIFRK